MDLLASVDDIQFDARGNIIIDGNAKANRDVLINANNHDLAMSGDINALRDISINAGGATNSGNILSGNLISIITNTLNNFGKISNNTEGNSTENISITANTLLDNSGEITSANDLNIITNNLRSSETIEAEWDIKISANNGNRTNNITNSGDINSIKNNIIIRANTLNNSGGKITADKSIDLDFGNNSWSTSGFFLF
jgi:hypothetical protein